MTTAWKAGIEAVRELHHRRGRDHHCKHCDVPYPCETIKVLGKAMRDVHREQGLRRRYDTAPKVQAWHDPGLQLGIVPID